jgi:ferric-dicitrate binding protein FerR (iron transport regulator)
MINTENEVFIKDIGTSFNVKAYPNSDTIIVTVESGEVQFYTLKDSGLQLKAGEAGIYSKSLKTFSKLAKADTNALAYKTKIFNFKNTELKKAIEMINEVYSSKIKLANESIGHCKLTVSFSNDKIEDIVEIIAETLGLQAEKKNNAFLLSGTGCVK